MSTKPNVYITRKIAKRGLTIIEKHFYVEVWPNYAPPSQKLLMEKLKNVLVRKRQDFHLT